MRTTAALTLLFAACIAAPNAQEDRAKSKVPGKGDAIAVKGCLVGGALEATESEALDATGLLAGGLTFRLTGNKATLKEMRTKHDRRLVSVKGTLKSDLPQAGGQGRTFGRTRITIGGATPSPNSPQAETRRSLPVLEVTSYDGGSTECGR
jgi:hypothetical protein